MTFAWGEENSLGESCHGIDPHCHPSGSGARRSCRVKDLAHHHQQQEQYRRSEKKERKQKNISITSLPSMPTSSLRSILKPANSADNLLQSNYLDKRYRIEDIDANVAPGVQAYWMRDQQLRKSLKRGKKVKFNENSNRAKHRAAFSDSAPGGNGTYYDDNDQDEESDERVGPIVPKSDEESYCKKRLSTPVASRRSNNRKNNSPIKKKPNEHYIPTIPPMASSSFDPYDGSSSSNYSYCPNEVTNCSQTLFDPLDLDRSVFVRSCVKVAADPNEDIINFNAIRRQSINRINAFMRSSGRYSQRRYNSNFSTMNRRINVPTRRSGRRYHDCINDPDIVSVPSNHIHVPLAAVYPNDFVRSSIRRSHRGAPNNRSATRKDMSYEDSFSRCHGHFERSFTRASGRSKHSGTLSKQEGAMTRGSSRRQSHRHRPGLENVISAEPRESIRRSRHRREDRNPSGHHRQSPIEYTASSTEEQPRSHIPTSATNLSANQPECPSSNSSSPYFVQHPVQLKKLLPEEPQNIQDQSVVPSIQPHINNPHEHTIDDRQIDLCGVSNENENNHIQVEMPSVPGGGGVPTVGGEYSIQRHVMVPLAEEVVAGVLRRSARQKKRGVAYYTYRKGKGEAVSDLEAITEKQPARTSSCSTEYTDGHWSAPESRAVSSRPIVAPKPPPRLDIIAEQQKTSFLPPLPEKVLNKQPIVKKTVSLKPPVAAGESRKNRSGSVDEDPISMINASKQLEKNFAHIARRCPPMNSSPDNTECPAPAPAPTPAPAPAPSSPALQKKDKDSLTTKDSKSKKQAKKKKEKKEEGDKKEKKKEEKERKKKKEKKKKKKKKKDKSKTKTSGSDENNGDKKKRASESGTQPANSNTNAKTAPKKVPLKPPRKPPRNSLCHTASENDVDREQDDDKQKHTAVIEVVNAGSKVDENDTGSEGGRPKRKSGLTRLSRKISDRVGTWGKDFKRLLSFRRDKTPLEDNSSITEDDNVDLTEVNDSPNQTEPSTALPTVTTGVGLGGGGGAGSNPINKLGTHQPQTKIPLLPPKCTPVPIPVPPPFVSSEKTNEDDLNFCDESKTNQIIFWLQNVQNIEEHLAMISATTVATQF